MRGVIFDLDGTLVDSLDDITAALGVAFTALGLAALERERVERCVGDGARMLVRRALGARAEEADRALEDDALERFRAAYDERLVVHTRAFDGAEALLSTLAARGTPTAVLSNKPHPMTRRVVEALFADHPFVEVLGQRPEVRRKPDPAAALELAARLEVPPAELLFVGDTRVDVRTAQAAGMVSVGVTWGMRPPAELAEADHRIDHPSALLRLLE